MVNFEKRICRLLIISAIFAGSLLTAANDETVIEDQAGYISGELIYPINEKPTPQCHASTIAYSKGNLVVAWFGGKKEKDPSVGIWLSRKINDTWTKPVKVAKAVNEEGKPVPCWNPVLFQPKNAPLMLFYKEGEDEDTWFSMLMTSNDGGETWSKAERLADSLYGSVKNKPIQLSDGTIVCPTSEEVNGWKVYMSMTADNGKTWSKVGPLNNNDVFDAIQPTLFTYPDGRIQALIRTRQKRIVQIWSEDNGKTWSDMTKLNLPNPNCAIDGVTLKDGRQLLVYNYSAKRRTPLNIAISNDGVNWKNVMELENQTGNLEFSYPSVIQTPDGMVHVVYTYLRESVKHVVIDPSKIGNDLNFYNSNSPLEMNFVYVAPGTFEMGSNNGDTDETVHNVILTKPYLISAHEVTQRQYLQLMGNNPSDNLKFGENAPVDSVTWYNAIEFCRRLTVQERINKNISENFEYRLPTEAEWEYAAKGAGKGDDFKFSGSNDLNSVAWNEKNSSQKTHHVGLKNPNGIGIYDMSGNVMEWTNDWYSNYPEGDVTDPLGPKKGSSRVARGGSYYYDSNYCRNTFRLYVLPDTVNNDIGFRIVLAGIKNK